ncbi:pyridoxal phosphate phosphatase PHOSPHO2-like isoform X2 [Lycorma delicatula]
MRNKNLVVFDFDHSIVDDNSDTVARSLVPSDYSLESAENVYEKTGSWTLYMKEIFSCLHKIQVSKDDIISAIHNIPPIRNMENVIKMLNNDNFEVIVISDSNFVFINEWLEGRKLEKVVKCVITNPAWFDDSGLLNIELYENQTYCDICPKNLCKGHSMEMYIENKKTEGVTFDHTLYIGDGSNDFCPTLKLSENDFSFPRINYALHKKIQKNQSKIKPQVFPWQDGTDILEVLKKKFGLNSLK